MKQEEKRIKEIEKEIESLKKEKSQLKMKMSQGVKDDHLVWMLSRIDMKVLFDNVLFLYCRDDEGLDRYCGTVRYTDGVKKFMDEVVKGIVEKLGNPPYYDLKNSQDDTKYNPLPQFRVLIFNVTEDNCNWNDTLEDVINKIKIEKDDTGRIETLS